MNTTLNELINEGYEILFAYVAGGELREWVKCEIQFPDDSCVQGFGKDVNSALDSATMNLQYKK
jgi:hypothetical protein